MAIRTPMPAVHPSAAPAAACLNCGTEVASPYCGGCGQAAGTARLSFPRLLRETLGGLLSLDSATLRTLGGLIRRPGAFVRGYLLGQRAGYVGPLRYYLLVIALNVGASALLQHPSTGAAGAGAERSFWDEHLVEVQIGAAFALLMLPLAAAQRVLHRRAGYSLAEHYAFALYLLAQSMLVVWAVRLALWPAGRHLRGDAEGGLWLAVFVSYLLWAGSGFYREPHGRVALKLIAALAGALACVAAAGVALRAVLGV